MIIFYRRYGPGGRREAAEGRGFVKKRFLSLENVLKYIELVFESCYSGN
jgi:hypothetical protein